MEFTSDERLAQLWALADQDPECRACLEELTAAKAQLEAYTDHLSREAHEEYWRLPVCIHTFFGRILELASRELRFPEEQ